MTGRVLPVLAYNGWQVEPVEADLGDGLREWIEIRHDGQTHHVASLTERDRLLRQHGINPAALTAVDHIDDGCE